MCGCVVVPSVENPPANNMAATRLLHIMSERCGYKALACALGW
jgi:hypothetical protein